MNVTMLFIPSQRRQSDAGSGEGGRVPTRSFASSLAPRGRSRRKKGCVIFSSLARDALVSNPEPRLSRWTPLTRVLSTFSSSPRRLAAPPRGPPRAARPSSPPRDVEERAVPRRRAAAASRGRWRGRERGRARARTTLELGGGPRRRRRGPRRRDRTLPRRNRTRTLRRRTLPRRLRLRERSRIHLRLFRLPRRLLRLL